MVIIKYVSDGNLMVATAFANVGGKLVKNTAMVKQ
jgi:hypothetical protein